MDIKEQIEAIVKKIKGDPDVARNFQKDPEKTIESLSGVNIPDGALDKVVSGVKAKLAAGSVAEKAEGAIDKVKDLFNK